MSNINIKAFFKSSKVKVTNQILDTDAKAVYVTVRFHSLYTQVEWKE